MWPIGYVYDCTHWCTTCLPVPDTHEDVSAMFSGEEADYPMHCAHCGALIRGVLTTYGFDQIKEDYLKFRWRNPERLDEYMEAFDYHDWYFIPTHYGWMNPRFEIKDID